MLPADELVGMLGVLELVDRDDVAADGRRIGVGVEVGHGATVGRRAVPRQRVARASIRPRSTPDGGRPAMALYMVIETFRDGDAVPVLSSIP